MKNRVDFMRFITPESINEYPYLKKSAESLTMLKSQNLKNSHLVMNSLKD